MKKILSLISLAALALAAAHAAPIAVGKAAPPFKLNDTSGSAKSLHDYLAEGPVALVFFRSGDW